MRFEYTLYIFLGIWIYLFIRFSQIFSTELFLMFLAFNLQRLQKKISPFSLRISNIWILSLISCSREIVYLSNLFRLPILSFVCLLYCSINCRTYLFYPYCFNPSFSLGLLCCFSQTLGMGVECLLAYLFLVGFLVFSFIN